MNAEQPKIVVVGEAWTPDDVREQRPFSGGTGRMLMAMLRDSGIDPRDCHFTSVFNLYPGDIPSPHGGAANDIKRLCGPKTTGVAGYPALTSGKYVRAEFASELNRLRGEINRLKPNLILALGATPCWALGVYGSLTRLRGAPIATPFGKLFPTYNPGALFRDWSRKPILLADLAKAAHEATFPEIRRPSRKLWLQPSFEDMDRFEELYIRGSKRLSVDIETSGDWITCVGFAPSTEVAIIIPFIRADRSPYWRDAADEKRAWGVVARWCRHRHIVGQNFLYDAHRLWRTYGIVTPGLGDDTMLLHHALFIELEKGLGFLGSVYTSEARWKFMRDTDTIKKEDE